MRVIERFCHWIRRKGTLFVGYALVVSRDTEITRLLTGKLMDAELYPYCFPDVEAVKEVVRRAIPFRLLVLDMPVVTHDEVQILCRARSNRLVPIILLSGANEERVLQEAGIEERYVYFVPKPIDMKLLRETILLARLQTA